MHFDLTNFLSGLTGALLGGLVLWVLSLVRRRESRDRSQSGGGGGQLSPSIVLAAAFILGVLIALYLLIAGPSE